MIQMLKFLAASLMLMSLATTAMALENDTRVFTIYPEIKVEKAHFHNRFGIDLTGDLYKPADFDASKK